MTTKELTKDIKSHIGGKGFINQSEVCRYLGVGKSAVREILTDVPYFETGREKKYAVCDVASAIRMRQV